MKRRNFSVMTLKIAEVKMIRVGFIITAESEIINIFSFLPQPAFAVENFPQLAIIPFILSSPNLSRN